MAEPASDNKPTAAQVMVEALRAEGVERVFTVPGEENLDLLDAMRTSGIEVIVTRHEQGAGFMAATSGRLTGKPGVCLTTLGPGATNLVTAVAYAQLGGMPLVAITGQKPIQHGKQGQFQILDVIDIMNPVTHYAQQVRSAAVVPALVREAFRRAGQERPGAALLELPEDIAREKMDSKAGAIEPSEVRRPVAEAKAIARAVELLQSARKPLLVIGAGANRKRTCEALRKLVDRTGLPVVSTQMGKGVLDESHEAWVGTASLSDGDLVHHAIEEADTILLIGHDVVEKPPFVMEERKRPVIHLNFSSAQVDPVYAPQTEVVGDIANALQQLNEKLEVQSHWDFDFARRTRKALDAHIAELGERDGFPLHSARMVREVRAAMPDEGIVTLDNGLYKVWFARHYPTHFPNTLLLDNALASMGAGLPSAMAAKIIHPDRPVLAVCGDGGFLMNAQELETAVRLELDLVILVLRDDAYGMIRWKQSSMKLPEYAMNYRNPDLVEFANCHGATGHRVEQTDQLAERLRHCLDAPGVHLIDCPVDYAGDESLLDEEIRELKSQLKHT
ncbi:MAG: acetolactate synthase large subunit [Akkermansiaceae bacterium]|nr:acetolactate synthase large subunit [Akkermansiaceae bacterium]